MYGYRYVFQPVIVGDPYIVNKISKSSAISLLIYDWPERDYRFRLMLLYSAGCTRVENKMFKYSQSKITL